MDGDGRSRRAQIDTETVKALLLMNGGAAVTLVTFLGSVLDEPILRPLARWVAIAIGGYLVGLLCAVVHNLLRRYCSMAYSAAEAAGEDTSDARFCACRWSIGLRVASIVTFGLASAAVVCGALANF